MTDAAHIAVWDFSHSAHCSTYYGAAIAHIAVAYHSVCFNAAADLTPLGLPHRRRRPGEAAPVHTLDGPHPKGTPAVLKSARQRKEINNDLSCVSIDLRLESRIGGQAG